MNTLAGVTPRLVQMMKELHGNTGAGIDDGVPDLSDFTVGEFLTYYSDWIGDRIAEFGIENRDERDKLEVADEFLHTLGKKMLKANLYEFVGLKP